MRKVLFIISTLGLVGLALYACPCHRGSKASIAIAPTARPDGETLPGIVERTYFIKGMHCGGCKWGVKAALTDSSLKIKEIIEIDHASPDPQNKIGHAVVQFLSKNYRGQETDCKIAQKIKDDLGYWAYWEKTNPNPCNF